MPSIEITAEQATQLARGEDITIAAPKLKAYIVTLISGNSYLVEAPENERPRENAVCICQNALLLKLASDVGGLRVGQRHHIDYRVMKVQEITL